MKLPENYKMLMILREHVHLLLRDSSSPLEINASDLYDPVKHDLRLKFKDKKEYYSFLREQHINGVLEDLIPECIVDDSNRRSFKYRFTPLIDNRLGNGKEAVVLESNYKLFKGQKNVLCSDGNYVRSNQEKHIYESLLKINGIFMRHDHLQSKSIDFFIHDSLYNRTYYWEHFGMTNSESYISQINEKINWLRSGGHKPIEEGGDLIITYFTTQQKFEKDVKKFVRCIRS